MTELNNYTVYHLHSDLSNAFTIMDSVTKFKTYVAKAKEYNMKAIAFSEHGSMLEWVKKKEYIEESGMKYIHAIETYVTIDKNEKIRDNFHVILIAKNYDGVQELLKMHSYDTSFNKEDGHFYYTPRITYDELKETSDNIIITTACLGGILNKANDEIKLDFINFMSKNKHRCFLEIQHHMSESQIKYNIWLNEISLKYDIPLIAGTDTHYLNEFHSEGRVILQKRKDIHFDNEDGWDMSFKSYNELINAYKEQNSLSESIYINAIENTNVMADMVEEFKLDKSNKYPKLYNNSEESFKEKIKNGCNTRGIKLTKEYSDRIKYEFNVMKKNGSIDYILLEETIKSGMAKNNIFPAPSRGSSSGSLINYLLGVTDIDSIKFDMNFERFMNPERQSLCDIDSDWNPLDRPKVKEFIYSMPNKLYRSEIVTFNTIALKGAIRDVAPVLGFESAEIDNIAKNIEEKEEEFRKIYPELFKYVDLLSGTIVSIGSHPAGTIVSPIPLDDSIGTFRLDTCDYPISQINMKEVDSLNFVKLDILGLANIGVINKSCEMAGIKRLTPDNLDFEDDNVWNHIIENKNNIFQFEGDYAHKYLKQCLRPEVVKKMRDKNPNLQRIEIMAVANGAIRPAGDSYREALSNGDFRDNGHKALNDFLAPTNGFLVYQEQVIGFLNKFCGYTMGEADTVRRGFAKKTGTEKHIPRIKSGFIKSMQKEYNTTELEAENIIDAFLVIIEDASRYLFSLNHAIPYSIIGYMTAYMRHYYPLEFLCASLIVNTGKSEKMSETVQYIKDFTDIRIKKIEFGKSKAEYAIDKKTNTIYKGINSIKYCNNNIANELFDLSANNYNNFLDLLIDINERTSVDARQLRILITLNFFSKFGKNKYLLDVVDIFNSIYYRKQLSNDNINELELDKEIVLRYTNNITKKLYKELDTYNIVLAHINKLENKAMSIKEQIIKELEFLEYINTTNSKVPKTIYFVKEFKTYKNKTKPYLILYNINNGEELKTKITKSNAFIDNPFSEHFIINVIKFREQNKTRKINGEWVKTEEKEKIVDIWEVL